MAAHVAGVFEENLRQKILESKILVVGAGGIGCEILKNLVLSGFPHIEIIDLDTIDVSNLNRQFLFHKEHVGKSKAEVARQTALKFNPNVNIKAYHDSITTTKYGVNFFGNFNLVLNALDNRQARNHVNRMCLTADVPLIESGTAGYNGQVELIKKGLTQCYECTPKQKEKTYPNCTIRNTPSEPIHCIVWAKHLFNQLFGEIVADEEVSPDTSDPENVGEAGKAALETEANEKGNVERTNTRQWAQNIQYDPEKLFNKFFCDDIKYLLTMSNLWKERTPPQPIKWENCVEFKNKEKENDSTNLSDQSIWSLSECAEVFANSVKSLKHELSKLPENDHLVWDKDDKNAMDFVTVCANIRASIFKIAQKSRFEIKSMAGNIIPAIATTNAITAGIVVMHAFKVLKEELDKCKSVYVRLRPNARNQIFVPEKYLCPPNPKCYVCSSQHQVNIKIDTNKMTIKEFRDNVLIKTLNTISPDVILPSRNSIVISSEEGETEINENKLLSEMGIIDGAILDVDDYLQQYNLQVIVTHMDVKRDDDLFEVISDPEQLKPPESTNEANENGIKKVEAEADGKAVEASAKADNENNEDNDQEQEVKRRKIEIHEGIIDDDEDDDDVVLVAQNTEKMEVTTKVAAGIKRKTDPGEGPSTSKRAKMLIMEEEDDIIVLDDD